MTDSYVLDRFENGLAVLEHNGEFIDVEKKYLPPKAKEGSVLHKKSDGTYYVDESLTEKLKKELFEKQNSLFDK